MVTLSPWVKGNSSTVNEYHVVIHEEYIATYMYLQRSSISHLLDIMATPECTCRNVEAVSVARSCSSDCVQHSLVGQRSRRPNLYKQQRQADVSD